MDGHSFDRITTLLATGIPRRAALRALVGVALAGVLTRLGLGGAAAACKKKGKPCDTDNDCCSNICKARKCRCRKNGATCAGSKQCCSSFCLTQEANAGPTCCVPNDEPCGQDSDCCQNVANPAACENDRCCAGEGRPCAVPGPLQTGNCCSGLVCNQDTLRCAELGLTD